MYGSRTRPGAHYYCRGCGENLPPEWHAQFHPACLKADKRRRMQDRRRLEQERFLAWLERQKCPVCGSVMRPELRHGRREASPAALMLHEWGETALRRRQMVSSSAWNPRPTAGLNAQ